MKKAPASVVRKAGALMQTYVCDALYMLAPAIMPWTRPPGRPQRVGKPKASCWVLCMGCVRFTRLLRGIFVTRNGRIPDPENNANPGRGKSSGRGELWGGKGRAALPRFALPRVDAPCTGGVSCRSAAGATRRTYSLGRCGVTLTTPWTNPWASFPALRHNTANLLAFAEQ